MRRLLADHNFDGRILRGLVRRIPDLDLVRAFDAGFDRVEDPELLAAAAADRVVVTHEVNTIPGFARTRVEGPRGVGVPVRGQGGIHCRR